MSDMTIHPIFPCLVAEIDNVLTEEENEKLYQECMNLRYECEGKQPWHCNIFSTFSYNELNLMNFEWFQAFIQKVAENTVEYLQTIYRENEKADLTISNCWFNISSKGDFQERHIHSRSHVSFVYYLKAPKGSNGTTFYNTYENMFSINQILKPKEDTRIFTSDAFHTPADERKLVLFQSHIPHMTLQHEIDEERVSISGNFTVKEVTDNEEDNKNDFWG